MNVRLLPDLERFVKESVSAGQYANSSEVVNSALAVLKAQDLWIAAHREKLRRQVAAGLRELERREAAEWDPEEINAAGRRALATKRSRGRGANRRKAV
jgi:putative addiction module CopG family antidote